MQIDNSVQNVVQLRQSLAAVVIFVGSLYVGKAMYPHCFDMQCYQFNSSPLALAFIGHHIRLWVFLLKSSPLPDIKGKPGCVGEIRSPVGSL